MFPRCYLDCPPTLISIVLPSPGFAGLLCFFFFFLWLFTLPLEAIAAARIGVCVSDMLFVIASWTMLAGSGVSTTAGFSSVGTTCSGAEVIGTLGTEADSGSGAAVGTGSDTIATIVDTAACAS